MRSEDLPAAQAAVARPTVFVSYTHDSEEHRHKVLEFATFLTGVGILVELDRWANDQRQDWQAWATKAMTEADYVLVVASPDYRRMGDGFGPSHLNLGGQSEAALLRDLLQGDREKWTPKILPVLLPGNDIAGIPLFLQPFAADRYPVESFTPQGAESLLRAITRQPEHIRPELGPSLILPPRSGPGVAPSEPTWTSLAQAVPVIWRDELFRDFHSHQTAAVELHLAPLEPVSRPTVRRLRSLGGELAELGRSQQLFSATEALDVGSSDQAAWARSATASGLFLHRSGQRTCWFPLPKATIGWILDEDDLIARTADRLNLLLEIAPPLTGAVAPVAGLNPAQWVRLGPLSDKDASSATFSSGTPPHIRLRSDESVPVAAIHRAPRHVADELVARLVSAMSA